MFYLTRDDKLYLNMIIAAKHDKVVMEKLPFINEYAASHGYVQLLEWTEEVGYVSGPKTIVGAASYQREEIILLFMDKPHVFTAEAVTAIIYFGCSGALIKLWSLINIKIPEDIIVACEGGDYKTISYMLSKYRLCEDFYKSCMLATIAGHSKFYNDFKNYSEYYGVLFLDVALKYDKVDRDNILGPISHFSALPPPRKRHPANKISEILIYLMKSSNVTIGEMTKIVLSQERYDILLELAKHFGKRHVFTSELFENAASFSSIKTIMWLKENGCAWNRGTAVIAACGGRLNVLKYLVENGCPVCENVFRAARFGGSVECLGFLNDFCSARK